MFLQQQWQEFYCIAEKANDKILKPTLKISKSKSLKIENFNGMANIAHAIKV
jgi:hypothetical protein